jgi:hypothetical protein
MEERVTGMPAMIVVLKGGKIFVNGLEETPDGVRLKCEEFISKENGEGSIKFWSDDESTYDQYLLMYNSILGGYRNVMDGYMMKNFYFSYRDFLADPYQEGRLDARNAAHQVYPQNLFDLSDTEKQLVIEEFPALKKHFDVK